MDFLISKSQSAFIKGRVILDSVASEQEVLLQIKEDRGSNFLRKLDFKKAFDNLRWDFLPSTLLNKGSSQKLINWINPILSSSKSSCLVNGKSGNAFKIKKGLKQGFPLSDAFHHHRRCLQCYPTKSYQLWLHFRSRTIFKSLGALKSSLHKLYSSFM